MITVRDEFGRDVTSEYEEQQWRDDYYGCPEYAEYMETWN